MIRPGSEIEFPPSPALCTKARMIARMDHLSRSSENILGVIAGRLGPDDRAYFDELTAMSAEQQKLVDNMKRILAS